MKILELRHLEGANIYTHRPVIRMNVDLEEYAHEQTDSFPEFIERLLHHIPSLQEHYCSRGRPGGFLERISEGTYLGHVIEHVALELQHLAGMDVVYGKTVKTDQTGVYSIITEYASREGGAIANISAVECVAALLRNEEPNIRGIIQNIYQAAAHYDLGPSTAAIAREAEKRGIPVMRLGEGSILQLGYGKYQKRVEATITGETSCISVDIACDKGLVKELLLDAGIPVPWGGIARSEKEALEIAAEIPGPVVVKPYDGNQGKGVALDLTSAPAIKRAFEFALTLSSKAIVEEFISGRHYRLLIIGKEAVAVSERIPAFVVGDGQSNISQLVDLVNRDPLRGEEHEKPLTKIKIDSISLTVLAKQGFRPDSVPGCNEVVYLRENANLSTGGIAIDVTGQVHPETLNLAVRAVQVVGLDVAGVDIVARDISRPLTSENGAVIEINAAPGIRMHHYPALGKARNVAASFVEHLFPSGSRSRVPIISVTGTNGKTTVTRLVSHILQTAGKVVGTATSDGIYLGRNKIVPGDNTGPRSARVILREPSVEAAVLETARGGIIRSGLGYDLSDVGVITNISRDHLGIDGVESLEEMADVKSVVIEAVHRNGTAVLNADDKLVNSFVERLNSGVMYFSMASDNIIVRRHLGAGGTAVFVKSGAIVLACGDKIQRVISIKRIPCTLGGAAQHNIENCLAAVAACAALGTELDRIRQGLMSFANDEVYNPGRLNFFSVGSRRVVVDYGHNEAGYLQTLQTLKRLKTKKIAAVVGMPGDRSDDDIITVSEIVAGYCDKIIIKEDSDLRGRRLGEVARLIKNTCLQAGIKEDRIVICLSESEAVKKGLDLISNGETLVIFYEKYGPVLEIIREAVSETEITSECEKDQRVMVN